MATRRALVGSLLLVACFAPPAPAVAQGAPENPVASPTAPPAAGATEAAPRKPRPRPARRQARPRRAPAQQQAAPAPVPDTEHRLEAAPVPNRNMEAPRTPAEDRTRLSPSVIHRPLPSQGMATEGAASIQEERLFFPAPGARLNVPFSY